MSFLPTAKSVLYAMQDFDDTFRPSKGEFPSICFETSLLMYIWIKINDKENIPKLVAGQYSCFNTDPNKRNCSTDNTFHIWILYKNKIIDYTHIQFELEDDEQVPTRLSILEKKFNLDTIDYQYDIDSVQYSDTISIKLFPNLQILVDNLINDYDFSSFNDFVSIYTQKVMELDYFLNNKYLLHVFDIFPQVLHWYSIYENENIKHLISIPLINNSLKLSYRYLTECGEDTKNYFNV